MSEFMADDPRTAEEAGPQPVARRRPGRKPGQKNRPPEAATAGEPGEETPEAAGNEGAAPKRRARAPKAEKVQAFAQQIFGVHQVLAAVSGAPEFAIGEAEAMALAHNGLAVAAEFDVELGGRWAALIGLIGTAGMIYVPRLIAANARMQKARRAKAAEVGPDVHGSAPLMPEAAHVFETAPAGNA